MEHRYNEEPKNWQNLFAITRIRHIEVLFHIYYYILKKSLLRPRYIEAPLYLDVGKRIAEIYLDSDSGIEYSN